MAAPESMNIKNLNGKFTMNKKLSDPVDSVLSLQGIGWLTRKAIGLANITLDVKQYEKDGVTHVDIDQTATGGVKGTTENRVLDSSESEHVDHVFGKVRGSSRYTMLSQVQDEFLKTGWLPESLEGEVIQSDVVSVDNGWTAKQIWGFENVTVDGTPKRYHTRHAVVEKNGKRETARLVYDYIS